MNTTLNRKQLQTRLSDLLDAVSEPNVVLTRAQWTRIDFYESLLLDLDNGYNRYVNVNQVLAEAIIDMEGFVNCEKTVWNPEQTQN